MAAKGPLAAAVCAGTDIRRPHASDSIVLSAGPVVIQGKPQLLKCLTNG